MPAVFGEVVMQTDEARRDFETHPVVMDAVARGMSVERYRALLLELYHVVWHFNPISAAAASRLSDQFVPVRYFLYEHMHEESGHEVWVRNDLEAIGVDPAQTAAHPPGIHTQALNGFNYWSADRRHPCSALGMLYALEVIASVYGGPFASAIQESLLLDGERGVSFISSHATLDAQHMAELRQVINTVEDDAARDAIIESAKFNFFQFKQVIASI